MAKNNIYQLAGELQVLRHAIERSLGIGGEAIQTRAGMGAAVPGYGTVDHRMLWKQRRERYVSYEERMTAQLLDDFSTQQAAVLEALRGAKGLRVARGIVRHVATGKQGEPEDYPTDVEEFFDKAKWAAWFALLYEPYYTDVVRDSGQAEISRFDQPRPFDLGDPRVLRAILNMRIKFADDINDTTQRRMADTLRTILQEADRAGNWSVPQVMNEIETRISNVFEVRKRPYERERIARTEMHKASEIGNQEGARQAASQAGLVMYKGWLAELDGRERDSHRMAHMTYQDNPIPLDQPFEVGPRGCTGMTPGNTGCVEEDVNCRCATLYFPREE